MLDRTDSKMLNRTAFAAEVGILVAILVKQMSGWFLPLLTSRCKKESAGKIRLETKWRPVNIYIVHPTLPMC